jgi:hypothetical protein
MSLSDLASLGSFVSGVAVMASLVYLALQVRQSAKHQRSLVLHGRAEAAQALALRLADPAMATVLDNALGWASDLTISELRQIRNLLNALLGGLAEAYQQHRDGQMSDVDFEAARQGVRAYIGFPRMRVLWRTMRPFYDPAFAILVEGLIVDRLPISPEAALAEYNRTVAAEVAATPTATTEE